MIGGGDNHDSNLQISKVSSFSGMKYLWSVSSLIEKFESCKPIGNGDIPKITPKSTFMHRRHENIRNSASRVGSMIKKFQPMLYRRKSGLSVDETHDALNNPIAPIDCDEPK